MIHGCIKKIHSLFAKCSQKQETENVQCLVSRGQTFPSPEHLATRDYAVLGYKTVEYHMLQVYCGIPSTVTITTVLKTLADSTLTIPYIISLFSGPGLDKKHYSWTRFCVGITSLHTVTVYSSTNVVILFTQDGWTALHMAAQENKVDVVRLLLTKAKSLLNIQTKVY